jgi:lactate dehydrogenase-like 2-hydroxyacid dehydrogenase
MPKPALLTTGPMMALIEEGIEKHFDVHRMHTADDHPALFKKIAPEVRAICTGSHTGVKTDAAMLARFPNLRIIGNFGVGYDTIDVAEAARRGIVITNTPDVLTEEVADTAIAVLLATVRELYKAEEYLRQGRWPQEGEYRLTASLRDRSIGMVGMGRIISYYARNQQPDVGYRHYRDIVAMARDVDTLIIIVPGGPATANLVNAPVLEALGPRGILINMARGSVVDEPALINALKERKILSAGLDVYWNEPNIDPAFLTLDNVTLYPHIGSASTHTRGAMGQLVVDNLAAYAAGKPPKTPVVETPFKGW